MPTMRTPAAALPVAAAVLSAAALVLSPGCGSRSADSADATSAVRRPTPPPVQPPMDFSAVLSYPLPPSRSAGHTLPGWRPDGKGYTPTSANGYSGGLPVSLAYQTPEGSGYYTADVNRITCRAEQGAVEWLGTRLGVKAVDRKVGEVRHYTRQDGLPGDQVEAIAADAAGVYCVVRVVSAALDGAPPPRVALCSLEPGSGRWKTLCEAVAPVTNFLPGQPTYGPSRLALTPNALVFAPPVLRDGSGASLYLLDRTKGTLRALAPDAALREASALSFTVCFLAADSNRAYVGTDAGLLTVPLHGGAAAEGWRRTLPGSIIDAGCLTPDGRTLWLAYHDRSAARAQPVFGGQIPAPVSWTLSAVAVDTGQVTPAAPEPGTAATPYYPCAVSVGPDSGGIWVTWAGPGRYAGALSGGFDRYDPATKQWTLLGLSGSKLSDAARQASFAPNSIAATGGVTPAPPRHVPDVAVMRLALDQGEIGRDDPLNGAGGVNGRAARWIRARFPEWICPDDTQPAREGAHLTSLDDPAQPGWVWLAQDGDLCHVPAADLPGYRSGLSVTPLGAIRSARMERYPFPGGMVSVRPSVQAITLGTDGSLLVRTRSAILRYDEGRREWKTLTLPAPMRVMGVLAAPGPVGRGGMSVSGGAPGVPSSTMSTMSTMSAALVRGGPDGQLLLSDLNGGSLYRLDPATASFTETGISAPPAGGTFLGIGTGGAWWQKLDTVRQSITLDFVPLGPGGRGAGPLEEIAPGMPPGWDTLSSPAPHAGMPARPSLTACGVVGDIAWFLLRSNGEAHRGNRTIGGDIPRALVGYDRRRRAWTAPLDLDPFLNQEVHLAPGEDGAAYVCGGADGTVVYRYGSGGAAAWQAVTPPLPAPPGPRQRRVLANGTVITYTEGSDDRGAVELIASDAQETWVTDSKRLYRYDRAAGGRWTAFDLPDALRTFGGISLPNQPRAVRTATAVWLGSDQGLWRFDRRAHSWQEVDAPITLEPIAAASTSAGRQGNIPPRMEIGAADARAVWGFVTPPGEPQSVCFRFDRQTHATTLYGRGNGLPPSTTYMRRMVADGNALWLLTDAGAYRLDPKTGRCVCLFDAGRTASGLPAASAPSGGARRGDVAAVTPDPAEPDSVYVLLGGMGSGIYAPNRADAASAQPVILYRFRKSTAHLEPLPISAALLQEIAPAHAATVFGTAGLLAGRDPSSPLWVGTTAGVCRVDRQTGAWSRARLPEGMPALIATSISRDGDGTLWLQGSDAALHLAGKRTPSVTPIATARR